MPNITFEWDASKASLNKKKHGISFDEAKNDRIIRIISARKATQKESMQYHGSQL
ncbi:MAG: BrnT family toxin [Gammaproteobacteria bacterium]|nr:BrnT family toxin [Gammaproteobacteria bacterium]